MLPFQTPSSPLRLSSRPPFSHLLPSGFHIKLVIACDPARHRSHSGGPCYMNEILVKCQYLCTYIRVASLSLSLSLRRGRGWMDGWMGGRQAGGAAVIPCRKLYRGIQAQSWKHVCGRRHLSRRPFSDSPGPRPPLCGQLAAPAAATVTGKVICQRMN